MAYDSIKVENSNSLELKSFYEGALGQSCPPLCPLATGLKDTFSYSFACKGKKPSPFCSSEQTTQFFSKERGSLTNLLVKENYLHESAFYKGKVVTPNCKNFKMQSYED